MHKVITFKTSEDTKKLVIINGQTKIIADKAQTTADYVKQVLCRFRAGKCIRGAKSFEIVRIAKELSSENEKILNK